ncbi:hypothetical protein [Paraburkholderia caballeronis]|uniref:hypothetical protein n=1 Tax=Paraburkholderia caballeronis TaxID=416943 RepID=UPI001416F172|nr:hypothetical protein [Paraburkholderia caballeronis]
MLKVKYGANDLALTSTKDAAQLMKGHAGKGPDQAQGSRGHRRHLQCIAER